MECGHRERSPNRFRTHPVNDNSSLGHPSSTEADHEKISGPHTVLFAKIVQESAISSASLFGAQSVSSSVSLGPTANMLGTSTSILIILREIYDEHVVLS